MYAVGLKDGDCYGLIPEPFLDRYEALEFIKKNDLASLYEEVYILADRYVYGPPLVEALKQS